MKQATQSAIKGNAQSTTVRNCSEAKALELLAGAGAEGAGGEGGRGGSILAIGTE